jgi:DNA polymerase-1
VMDGYPKFIASPDPGIFLSDNYLVLDFETTNREHGIALDPLNGLLLACWRRGRNHPNFGRGESRAVWGDEFAQGELTDDVGLSDFVVAHFTKFELQWLRRCGADLRRILPACTLIAEKVLWANRPVELSLDATLGRRGIPGKHATVAAMIHSGVCPSEIPRGMLQAYCEWDVASTELVYLEQRKELEALNLLPVYFCRNIVTPVLADIEFNGMRLDRDRVEETHADYSQRYNALEEKFRGTTGGINFKSGKQIRQFLYGKTIYGDDNGPFAAPVTGLEFAEITDHRGNPLRTGAGNAKTDKHTLALLVATTPEQKEFKRLLTELAKLRVPMQNLVKMKGICDANPEEPTVYATFNQTNTDTDRLSSTGRRGGFQFHNFDRAFKRLFRARRPGWKIGEGDAPQLEFRVAAFLGNDADAKRDISEGVDVHANTAQALYGRVTPELRQSAKPLTFKPLYGGNSGTPRELKYFRFFRERYDGIYRTQSGWTMDVARSKFLVTPWGLRFYWPDAELTTRRDGSVYVTRTTQIFNYPVQSLATADIIPLTLVLLWHRIEHLPCFIVNTIHDSIILEFDENCLDSLMESVIECYTIDVYRMLRSIYGIKFDIPLGVEWKSAEHWGEGKGALYDPRKSDFAAPGQLPADNRIERGGAGGEG